MFNKKTSSLYKQTCLIGAAILSGCYTKPLNAQGTVKPPVSPLVKPQAQMDRKEAVSTSKTIIGLFGKSQSQVEKQLGKGNRHGKSYFYKVKGLRSIEIEYASAKYGIPELNGKVLAVSCHFLKPLPISNKKIEEEALHAVGLSSSGIIYGDKVTNSDGYFKNVQGIPISFIGDARSNALYFTHWSYLSLSMGEWSRPKG